MAFTNYFVDGVNGNDSYNGLYARYTSGSNGPKKTLQQATNLVTNSNGDYRIVVAPGEYTDIVMSLNYAGAVGHPNVYWGDTECLITDGNGDTFADGGVSPGPIVLASGSGNTYGEPIVMTKPGWRFKNIIINCMWAASIATWPVAVFFRAGMTLDPVYDSGMDDCAVYSPGWTVFAGDGTEANPATYKRTFVCGGVGIVCNATAQTSAPTSPLHVFDNMVLMCGSKDINSTSQRGVFYLGNYSGGTYYSKTLIRGCTAFTHTRSLTNMGQAYFVYENGAAEDRLVAVIERCVSHTLGIHLSAWGCKHAVSAADSYASGTADSLTGFTVLDQPVALPLPELVNGSNVAGALSDYGSGLTGEETYDFWGNSRAVATAVGPIENTLAGWPGWGGTDCLTFIGNFEGAGTLLALYFLYYARIRSDG